MSSIPSTPSPSPSPAQGSLPLDFGAPPLTERAPIVELKQTIASTWSNEQDRWYVETAGEAVGRAPATFSFDANRNVISGAASIEDAIRSARLLAREQVGHPVAVIAGSSGFSAVALDYRHSDSGWSQAIGWSSDYVSIHPDGSTYERNRWTSTSDALRALVDRNGVVRFEHKGEVHETLPVVD